MERKCCFCRNTACITQKVNARSKNIEAAEPCDGPFIIALGELCRRYGLWIAAGMYERTDGLPYNTIAVLDDRGRLRGTHRKNRLYDAFGYRESDECRTGDKPFSPIETPVGKLGIITCFELRFPALAAEQKARGAETLFVPAAGCRARTSCCTGAHCCAREPSRTA